MNQALYEHMNNKRKMEKKKENIPLSLLEGYIKISSRSELL
jgi:hypothetical protein